MHQKIIIHVKTIKRIPLFCQKMFLQHKINKSESIKEVLCSVRKSFSRILAHQISKSQSILKVSSEVLCSVRISFVHQIDKSQSILKVSSEVLCSVRISFMHQINKSQSILKVSSEVLCQCQNKFLVHGYDPIYIESIERLVFFSVRIVRFSPIKSTNHNLY